MARHHLDKLAAAGHLIVDIQREPKLGDHRSAIARLSPISLSNFRLRHDDLMGTLLGRALALLPPEEADRLAEEVGHEYSLHLAAEMAPGDAHRSLHSAVATVAETLTSHGFAAHSEGTEGQLRIVSEHCPFGQAAIDHPVLCAIDRGSCKRNARRPIRRDGARADRFFCHRPVCLHHFGVAHRFAAIQTLSQVQLSSHQ